MDQVQNRAVAALQPFLHLTLTTKSPTPRVLADFITRATSAPGTYVFAELLQTPAIQSLRSPDIAPGFRSYHTLLEIFSFGTLADYQSKLCSYCLASESANSVPRQTHPTSPL
jgi:COP9 signalosome complex subunit 7